MTQSDVEFIEEILAGNSDAFGVLVRRYERAVRAAALSVVRTQDAADDAAQEAFVRAWEQLPKLRNRKVFGLWLLKITRRCAIDSLKKQQSLTYSDSLDLQASHERNGELDEKNKYLLETIATLPRHEWQIVMLRYFGPHSVAEVAAALNRSIGTVTKQLSRAHRRLKKRLEEFDHETE